MRGEIVRRSTDRSFALGSDDIAPDRDRRSIDQPIATIPHYDRRNGFYQRMVKVEPADCSRDPALRFFFRISAFPCSGRREFLAT